MPRRQPRNKPTLPPADLGELPPLVRREARTGPRALMRSEWTDPDDIRPNGARVAKRVPGMRVYDPIIVMWVNGTATGHHVHAANKLRELVDAARLLGFTGGWLEVFGGAAPGPLHGQKPSQVACAIASRRLAKLWPRFDDLQWRRLNFVVLECRTISAWVRFREERTGERCNREYEQLQLLKALEDIWLYFETELSQELDAGRRLPV